MTAVAAPLIAEATPEPTRRELIGQHLFALKRLCEEYSGEPWQIFACTAGDGPSRILAIHADDELHDPYGIIGLPMRYGKPVVGGEA
ncbi:hypothetical protein [Mesorhizobium sp. A556]